MIPKSITIITKNKVNMKVITYTDSFELKSYNYLGFDYEKAMVRLVESLNEKEYYFESVQRAMEFSLAIIEGIYSKTKTVDLSHIRCVSSWCNLNDAQSEIENKVAKGYHEME